MGPDRRQTDEIGEGYDYISLGISFAAGILLFMAGGWLLDKWLGITPILTIVGTLAGTAVSITWVYVRVRAATGGSDADEDRKSK
ncbi:MAG TPA: AtpZ/AtpI family protein [Gemmatimonadales bacterium]|jgi:F0F1-type ATP synthase assembly protein I|nr:AtpZ/AtpI family protein [Gemmatimonadales bacterium]